MKNCFYWWFTVKNFGRKCHHKNKTKHSYGHLVVSGQGRKLPPHLHYHGKRFYARLAWIFSMFESRLSWHCYMFDHGCSNKSFGTSEYCRREAILRVLESMLCKVLLSFDNSGLINGALVFLVSCKFGPGRHPLFCLTAQKLKFSIKDFFSKWVGHIYWRNL